MKEKKRSGLIPKIVLLAATVAMVVTLVCIAIPSSTTYAATLERSDMLDHMMETATSYVVVYHKQLGGSHYAYTEGLAEEMNGGATAGEGNEATFSGGSRMSLITLRYEGDKVIKEETNLVRSSAGVIRDPAVSPDGTKIVYSLKTKTTDDYHLYIYDLETKKSTQITFGNGVADIEPVFNADGSIIFNSTRDIQTVDCWYTPVSNLYKCDADGGNIVRLGYDQVHTTFPTATEDGRILYTRWDYNDRNQMYVQAIFQMQPDGTGQTEVFGNNLSAPTSLIHTREIPGMPGKYITITCGHHQKQCGKLAVLDTSVGRNTMSALDFVWNDSYTRQIQASHDNDVAFYQEGRVYKYPYPISETEFLVSTAAAYEGTDTAFNIELISSSSKKSVVIAEGSKNFPASQIVPIKTTDQFNHSSFVDYSKNYGTFYVGNVYAGQKGIKDGDVKYLRVVALEFRSSAIGATNGRGTGTSDPYSPIATGNGSWDIKKVLGIVPVYEDGSALFTCPAGVPVYFQLLDENGDMIQSMRSWSTLQPGEYFSCVGCHVDKNQSPGVQATVTQAMNHGVVEIQPDLWMSSFEDYEDYDPYTDDLIGFDYLSLIQPILDRSCITCHSDAAAAYSAINASAMNSANLNEANLLSETRDSWYYTTGNPGNNWKTADVSGSWTLDYAPFGKIGTAPGAVNTVWTSGEIYLRKTVTVTNAEMSSYTLKLRMAYTGTVEVFVNGTSVYNGSGTNDKYQDISLSAAALRAFKAGSNEIAVKVSAGASGQYFDLAVIRQLGGSGNTGSGSTTNLFSTGATWTYFTSANDEFGAASAGDWTKSGFNTSAWTTGKAPLGNRVGNQTSDWATGGKNYIFARYTFTVKDLSALGSSFNLYTKIFYDDDIHIYLNGNEIFSNGNWNDGYEDLKLASGSKYLVQGENVIAVSLHQHTGGYEFDMSLYAIEEATDVQISLQGSDVFASRMKKAFPLSYLLLTASKGEGNGQFVANSVNKYTNWISSMSQCEMLNPYAYGAQKSNLIRKLRTGHGDLSDEEIRAIACWIDLEVPCYGSYDVRANWGTNEIREYEEELNKRELYDKLNEYAILARAGQTPEGEITITYNRGNKAYTATGEGMVVLYVEDKYAASDTLKVQLPSGEKYLALSLSSRVGESIIYCPNSTFEMKLPNLNTTYPNTMDSGEGVAYISNTITARIVPESELLKVHNLAQNSYDVVDATTGFPHVTTTGSIKDNRAYFEGRNVIDGFTANKSRGEYPAQSWQPASVNGAELKIDFGRTVKIDELRITVRRAEGDSYFTDCILTLSDGSTRKISLTDSAQEQIIDLGGVETSSITFSGFTVETSVSGGNNYGITEIKAMGTEVLK